jgi:hypothetical protein
MAQVGFVVQCGRFNCSLSESAWHLSSGLLCNQGTSLQEVEIPPFVSDEKCVSTEDNRCLPPTVRTTLDIHIFNLPSFTRVLPYMLPRRIFIVRYWPSDHPLQTGLTVDFGFDIGDRGPGEPVLSLFGSSKKLANQRRTWKSTRTHI